MHCAADRAAAGAMTARASLRAAARAHRQARFQAACRHKEACAIRGRIHRSSSLTYLLGQTPVPLLLRLNGMASSRALRPPRRSQRSARLIASTAQARRFPLPARCPAFPRQYPEMCGPPSQRGANRCALRKSRVVHERESTGSRGPGRPSPAWRTRCRRRQPRASLEDASHPSRRRYPCCAYAPLRSAGGGGARIRPHRAIHVPNSVVGSHASSNTSKSVSTRRRGRSSPAAGSVVADVSWSARRWHRSQRTALISLRDTAWPTSEPMAVATMASSSDDVNRRIASSQPPVRSRQVAERAETVY